MSRLEVEVRPATPDDIKAMAGEMRYVDRLEAKLMYGGFSADMIERSVEVSDWCDVGLLNGELGTMFGVACHNRLCGIGTPWLLGTSLAEQVKDTREYRSVIVNFLRQSRSRLEDMKNEYRLLENFVYANNHSAIRWLGWLGFALDPPQPMGPKGAPFRRFSLRTHHESVPDVLPRGAGGAGGGRAQPVVDGEGVPGARTISCADGEGC